MDQLEEYELGRLESLASHTISQMERLQAELADAKRSNANVLAEWRVVKDERDKALADLADANEKAIELSYSLHAAEMRNHEYASGEAIQEMATQIGELQAELAAVPRWVRITDDPKTWPDRTGDDVLHAYQIDPGDWEYEVVIAFALAAYDETEGYWLPITPPQEAERE